MVDLKLYRYIFIIFIVIPLTIFANLSSSRQTAILHLNSTINNFIIDKDIIYVGTVNELYKLGGSSNLSILQKTSTGPILDSPLCNYDLSSCVDVNVIKEKTDNYNKLLQKTPSGQLLICGSTRQGICNLYNAEDITLPIQNGTVPIVSNSQNSSTVGLIDPITGKLYIATSYSTDSPYRDNHPSISTREAPQYYPINYGSIEGEGAIQIRVEHRGRFKINYISVFKYEHYIFWASVQNKNIYQKGGIINAAVSNPLVTKLLRVCEDDERYISYSELEIQCRGEDNTNYNILKSIYLINDSLIGAFTDSSNRNTAICIFSMGRIQSTFWYNIDRCRDGIGKYGMPHIGRDYKCTKKPNLQLDQDTCFLGVGGSIESEQVASIIYNDRIITTITGRNIGGKTIIVAGTEDGDILQYSLTISSNSGTPISRFILQKYAEFTATPDFISNIQFMNDNEYIIASANQLSIIRVSSCSYHDTCESCTQARDPLCGWCLLEGKCSQLSECMQALPNAFLLDTCPNIEDGILPIPMNVSVDEVKKKAFESVFLPITSLPSPKNFNYECYFGNIKSKGSTWSSKGITCLMPEKLPRIPNGSDNYVTSLTLHTIFENRNSEMLGRSKAIASFNFTFYTCKSNRMCSSCTSSKWNCKWCSGNNLCLSINSNKTCNDGITDVDSCIKIDISNIQEILVGDGSNHSVQFPVINWKMDKNNDELYCKVLFENPIITKATIKGQSITCDSIQYNYEEEIETKKVGLELLQKDEIIDRTEISMYKCNKMASDCSQCLSLDPKYGCSWCKESCKISTKCSALSSLRGSRFSDMRPDNICTNPIITNFEPKSGPIEGGTTVTITGRDLGTKINDVRDRVYVGGSLCKVIGFEISKKIVCITERGTGTGVVKITIGSSAKRIVESNEVFEYLDIQAQSIYPTFGPISGGTQISIYGNNLNVGSNISIHLDNLPCTIDSNRNSSQIISCKTSKSPRIYHVSTIRLQIDSAIKIIDGHFEYREDPIITNIRPSSSFRSGGRLIAVYGSHFDSLLSAQMYLLNSNDATVAEIVSGLGVCKISNSTLMYCKSPKLMHHSTVRSKFSVGFFMDDVDSVRNLGNQIQMTITPDPIFDFFTELKMHPTDQTVLILTGNHLSVSTSSDDYQVYIGTESCNVVLLDYTQLICRIPETQPSGTDENGIPTFNNYPLVVVKIGNLRFEIGSIEYESLVGGDFGVMRMPVIRFILLLITVIFAIILIIFCLITIWKRRNGERERDYKRIQQQMEQMESNVRNECKQAFAELQTDMTDLTLTIEDIGIPYQNMGYFLKILLSHEFGNEYSMYLSYNMTNSGVGSIYVSQQPMVITQFESLVFNRQFIFMLVHMLESNPSITTNERTAVASSIVTCISRNMEYCTEVIFTLLESHIENSVHNKTSHLLFRRSESVIEKLFSHWLSISMFPELCNGNNDIAKSLYLLYRALKYQIEKGPIDAVTGDSRYSLNEQKLLREHVDGKVITLIIIPFESFDQFPIQLRVLHCDTITQVKSKLLDLLYKNQGFQNRLTVEQFDLVWQNSKKEHVVLVDDEKPMDKREKQLNTIGSYNIPVNATITMEYANIAMPLASNAFTFRSGSSDTTCSAWSSTHLLNNSSNCSVSPPPLTVNNDKKYYHLNNGLSTKNGFSTIDGKRNKDYEMTYTKNLSKNKGKVVDRKHCNTLNITPNSSNIPEVFLTRLLTCKGSVQKFVEDFFENVLLMRKDCRQTSITIKYVCDFFDYQAKRLNITDEQIIFTWKKNSIVLRLMMNFINNPDFIFDIQSQNYLNSSLTVIGQTLMDCFSTNPHPFSKESPSSKLLFAKEINRYRPFAMELFTQISHLPPITDKVFYNHINNVSQTVTDCLSKTHAITELLNWIKGNALPLVEILNHDEGSIKHRLGEKLQQIVMCTIQDSEHIYATLN
uniref:Sema domain-containing protein n=1 Tax=Strongyloides papillosus TaxID=174720 RepID=A0A0N5B395_STREA